MISTQLELALDDLSLSTHPLEARVTVTWRLVAGAVAAHSGLVGRHSVLIRGSVSQKSSPL